MRSGCPTVVSLRRRRAPSMMSLLPTLGQTPFVPNATEDVGDYVVVLRYCSSQSVWVAHLIDNQPKWRTYSSDVFGYLDLRWFE